MNKVITKRISLLLLLSGICIPYGLLGPARN